MPLCLHFKLLCVLKCDKQSANLTQYWLTSVYCFSCVLSRLITQKRWYRTNCFWTRTKLSFAVQVALLLVVWVVLKLWGETQELTQATWRSPMQQASYTSMIVFRFIRRPFPKKIKRRVTSYTKMRLVYSCQIIWPAGFQSCLYLLSLFFAEPATRYIHINKIFQS